MPHPGSHDWLAAHREPGQSYEQHIRARPNLPNDQRNVIYLQPLNDFPEDTSPSTYALESFAAAFFGLEVVALNTVTLGDRVTTRMDTYSQRRQLLTTDILSILKETLPPNAYCWLGITMEDIYPGPEWNYVFGEASLRERVAVYSFARYDPAFYGESNKDRSALILNRSCKVLAHETAHMFGIRHCIAFSCLMNGSNHLEETDSTPMHLCPIDLRKLQWSIGFDVRERYSRLAVVYHEYGMKDEARWISRRQSTID
ncbi:MAG: hypothetical protein GY906_31845 [bacterium]|nr:hypothetical protein [bacterium]